MTRREYLDFDLAVEPEGESFRARVLDAPSGEASAGFVFPFSDLEMENFLLRVGRTRRGVRRIDSPEMDAARRFGGRLYDTVLGGEVGTAYRRSLDEADRQGKGLRLRLRVADSPLLSVVPWEFLYSEGLGEFVVLSERRPVVRYLDLPSRIRPLAVAPPLRILVVVSNPSDVAVLDVARERELLSGSLGDLATSGRVVLEFMEAATLGHLTGALRRSDVHILHFMGHGGFDERSQDGVLVFEDDQGRSRRVGGDTLGTLLNDHDPLRLVVLNACEGARGGVDDPFSGVAQALVRRGIPAVIAMQFEITDGAAIGFAHEFYLAVADGYPVDAACTAARKAVFAQGNDVEWATPVLYLRAPDGKVFDITAPPAPEPEPEPAPEPEPEPEPSLPGVEAAVAAVEATYQRGVEAQQRGQWGHAARHFAEVVAADPGWRDAAQRLDEVDHQLHAEELLAEATHLQAQGDMAGAAAHWDELERVAPELVDTRLREEAEAAVTPAAPRPVPPPQTVSRPEAPRPAAASRSRVGIWLLAAAAVGLLIWLGIRLLGGGGQLVVGDANAFYTGELTIDGHEDDWGDHPFYDSDAVIAGEDTGVRASWMLAWNEEALYVLAGTNDPSVTQDWGNQPSQLWKGDSVSFEFGPDPSALGADEWLRDTDRHVMLGPLADGSGVVNALNPPTDDRTTFRSGTSDSRIIAAARVVAGEGYVLEAKIPWEVLEADPSQQIFGMNLNISDGDGAGNLAAMVSSNPDRSAANQGHPGTWQTVALEAKP